MEHLRYEPRLATSADLAPGARVASRQASRYLDLAPISVMVDLEGEHRVLPGAAARLEEEAPDSADAKVGPPPPALLESARAAAERAAQETLRTRVAAAHEGLAAHADAEEERLVEAAFQGGAPRESVESALVVLRQHRDVVGRALDRAKLELDTVAVVVP